MNVIPTQSWKGFDPFTPLLMSSGGFIEGRESKDTSKTYADILHRVGWKILDSQNKVKPWHPHYASMRAPAVDAWLAVVNCGRQYGYVLSCECGSEFARPFGCSNRWCLYCEGIAARKRAGRIQNKTDRLSQGEDFVWGRCVFTVHPDHQPYCSSKEGSITMQKRAFSAMSKVLNVPKKNLAVFTTFHPTSSKHPWQLHPHVELIWAHANVSSDRIVPLETNESGILLPIELDYLQDIWQGHYPGTKNLNVSYKKELHFGHLLYLVRPMAEDVYYAIQDERLAGDKTGTIPPQAEVSFREPGGVEFWKSYHRVRWHGAVANRKWAALMRSLEKPRIESAKACIDCPDCKDGELTIEKEGEGIRTVSVSPYAHDLHHIMFTTWKSNSRKGDEAVV